MTAKEFISRYRPACFYHFTDLRNLAGIRDMGGILPLKMIREMDLAVPAPGGNDWSHDVDGWRGLDNYVHMCLMDNHPMEYRAREEGRIGATTFLRIDPSVLEHPQIRLTPDVSNKSGVRLLTIEEACQVMDFEVVYDRTDWRDPEIKARRLQARKYEILYPDFIPLSLIKNL